LAQKIGVRLKRKRLFIVLLVLLASGTCMFFLLRSHRTTAPEQAPPQSTEGDETKPVAQVEVVPIQRKSISEKLTAYGSVVAQPGKTHFVAISFESRVQHILVSSGQLVKQGDTWRFKAARQAFCSYVRLRARHRRLIKSLSRQKNVSR
jgi:multidrug efflux pump subunit AcrA (membrane-fusion protein)